jgi:phenylalanyl-tRNA synthetase beta subunit
VTLFDYFKAKKSLAIRVTLAAKDKTLKSAEVEKVMEKIISALEKELKVEVRK